MGNWYSEKRGTGARALRVRSDVRGDGQAGDGGYRTYHSLREHDDPSECEMRLWFDPGRRSAAEDPQPKIPALVTNFLFMLFLVHKRSIYCFSTWLLM